MPDTPANPFSVYFFMAFFVPSFVLVISVILYFLAYFIIAAAVGLALNALSILAPLPPSARVAVAFAFAGAALALYARSRRRKPRGLIAPLRRIDDSRRALYGDKAASLGELCRAGLRVPFGYAVSARLFERFARRNKITIPQTISADPEQRKAALHGIRNEIRKGRFGPFQKLRLRLMRFCLTLRWGVDSPVIVRSSFGGEDAPGRLAPGQYRSYVCHGSFSNFLGIIVECWRSFFTDDACMYRERMGVSHEPRLSLIVQGHLRAELLGTAAAANPATGYREEYVIDVSAAPENAVHLATEQSVAESIVVNMARDYPHPPRDKRFPFLPSLVAGLRELARSSEHAPLVEWAVAGGKLYFLQLRPLAQLPGVRTFISAGMAEITPEPLSPMTLSLITSVRTLDSFVTEPILKYMKKTLPENILKKIGSRVYADFEALDWTAAALKTSPSEFLSFVRLCRKQAPETRGFLETFGRLLAGFGGSDFSRSPTEKLLSDLKSLNEQMNGSGAGHQAACAHLAQALAALLERTASAFGIPLETIRALPPYEAGCAALERASLLMQLSAAYAGEAAGGKKEGGHSKELIEKYIEKFGFLGPADEIDLATPRIRENPERFAAFISSAGCAAAPVAKPQQTPLPLFLKHRGGNLIPWDFLFFRTLLKWTKTYATLRENLRCKLLEGWAVERRILLELARREPFSQELSSPEKIFFLEFGELKSDAAAGIGKAADERAKMFEDDKKQPSSSVLHLDEEGKTIDAPVSVAADEADGVFRGIAASPGAAAGVARRVAGPDDVEKVLDGDIAVVDACSPWMSVLFHRAAGIVATTGGTVSHLALAAREFGRPMLVAVHGLRGVEVDGRKIEIDTVAGTARFIGEN